MQTTMKVAIGGMATLYGGIAAVGAGVSAYRAGESMNEDSSPASKLAFTSSFMTAVAGTAFGSALALSGPGTQVRAGGALLAALGVGALGGIGTGLVKSSM